MPRLMDRRLQHKGGQHHQQPKKHLQNVRIVLYHRRHGQPQRNAHQHRQQYARIIFSFFHPSAHLSFYTAL